ncbi:DNA polymerase delta subunit like [Quillaja saponaria]|uniref:DNA polymerase delta subunit 3 n=1 Tax=Quillaja saponaria TaxID=32244 RepID=A0AAD7L030_QUISA|nr:DNA polymerase delta subunit like [Quillaja saponaria]
MAQIETLGILEEIEALVSDKLQVVSYKWLSRNYLVSSNVAKRLLQEFVEKHKSGLEVIFTLAGWLKSSSPSYRIILVSWPKLPEVKQEFDGNCSVQVYSVQASIPKDPAVLWNAEFVQAEELFKQPSSVNNCLRDNRFCGVSNSFVRRSLDGAPGVLAPSHAKSDTGIGPTKTNFLHQNTSLPQPQQNKILQSSTKGSLQSSYVVKDVKTESNGTGNARAHDQTSKTAADKSAVLHFPAGKKKAQNDKSVSSTGGSLANLWDRASTKPKPSSAPAETSDLVPNPTANAEAQICAHEMVEGTSSDDDDQDFKIKRASTGEGCRKRRVVFDLSDEDEYEDAINLASPDIPKEKSCKDQKQNGENLSEKTTSNFDNQMEIKSVVREVIATDVEANQPLREDSAAISKGTDTGESSKEKIKNVPESHVSKKDNVTSAVPGSPKRRKVLKSRIDERGREVTEVIWEGEATEAKKSDSITVKKADNNPIANAVNRPPAAKKSPAMANTTLNPTAKAGSKKAGSSKDPKQGNILSFFKRV